MVELHSRLSSSRCRPRICSSAVATLVLLVATSAFLGCGESEGPQRNRVSGSVTLDGQPVPNGLITFEPDSSKGHTGPQGLAPIRDGRFDTDDTGGRGIIGGPHRVRIVGYRGEAADPQSSDPSVPSTHEILLDNYETEVNLLQGDATHNFTITSDDLRRSLGR